MSLIQYFLANGPSGFGYGSTAEEVTAGLSLAGKTVLVTGCNSGLGLEALRVLALRGARVVGTARTVEKARTACAGVSGTTVPLACELTDPASVRACVAAVIHQGIKLDALICNAGIMALPKLEKAHGLDQALEKIAERPQVMLVDYHLHDRMDGLDALVALREAAGYPLPGALLTADGRDELKRMARERGYRVLTKPIKPASLRAFLGALRDAQ